jgi:hypothetical protein
MPKFIPSNQGRWLYCCHCGAPHFVRKLECRDKQGHQVCSRCALNGRKSLLREPSRVPKDVRDHGYCGLLDEQQSRLPEAPVSVLHLSAAMRAYLRAGA